MNEALRSESLDSRLRGNDEPLRTPLDMLYHWEQVKPGAVYLRQPVNGEWRDFTWHEVGELARRVAAALKARGYARGSRIALWSKNCAEWVIVDLGIMLAGHVSVPLYATQSVESARAALELTEAPLIFLGKLDDPVRVTAALPDGIATVALPYPTAPCETTWRDFIAIEPDREDRRPALDELMTIAFTSGTTGMPKGAMHSYRSPAAASPDIARETDQRSDDVFLSYLPLAHLAERVVGEMGSLYAGFSLAFVESLETFPKDLRTVRPTLFLAVPRLWALFQQRVHEQIAPATLQRLLRWPLIGRIVAHRILRRIGLDRVRRAYVGSAPTPVALLEWWADLGIEIIEGYGMTENFAHGCCNVDGRRKFGTVGRALPVTGMKLTDEGEVMFGGPAVMLGYYKDPESTALALRDGYYYSGDLGELDAEGCLRITGRTKELFKTAKGEYIAPYPLEGEIARNPLVGQVCVMGAGMRQPVALVGLTDVAKTRSRELVERELTEHLQRINPTRPPFERIERILVCDETWSIDNGMLTPTLKLRRALLEQRYHPLFDALGDRPDAVVWEH